MAAFFELIFSLSAPMSTTVNFLHALIKQKSCKFVCDVKKIDILFQNNIISFVERGDKISIMYQQSHWQKLKDVEFTATDLKILAKKE